jgi:hypothetical protein
LKNSNFLFPGIQVDSIIKTWIYSFMILFVHDYNENLVEKVREFIFTGFSKSTDMSGELYQPIENELLFN